VLRPLGRLAFTVIELAPRMSSLERRAVGPLSPRAVGTRRPYPAMLASAGFDQIGSRDITSEYLATVRAWLSASEPRRGELIAVDGETLITDRLEAWRGAIVAVEAGWLRRTLYWATRK
jgi:hypothetical protein